MNLSADEYEFFATFQATRNDSVETPGGTGWLFVSMSVEPGFSIGGGDSADAWLVFLWARKKPTGDIAPIDALTRRVHELEARVLPRSELP